MDFDTQLQRISTPAFNASAPAVTATDMAQSAISFLDLPAEVRNMIYYYLFPEGRSAVQLLKRNVDQGYIDMSDRLGIVATCRQTYKEATSVLQEQGRLVIAQPKTLKRLIQELWMDDDVYYDSDDGELFDHHILQQVVPLQGIRLDYDLDRRVLVSNAPALMYTNQWLRNMCIANPCGARITALCRTTSAKSAFSEFQALQTWIKDGHANPTRWDEPYDFKTKIVLAFDISVHIPPADIEFDATAFVRATRRLQRPGLVQVEVISWARYETRSETVVDIQTRVLLFMWNLIQTHPEARLDPCPTIWFNGMHWALKAEFVDKKGGVRIVMDEWMSGHEERAHLSAKASRVVEALRRLGDPDYSGPEDENEDEEADMDVDTYFLFEMDFDQGSLLGVAADLAQLIYDNFFMSF
ncbi:hypothetical protein N0V86_009569 [Didymella sp. IMI 355093]|nr:hypothetical protein N0V86_009569 [Didymella sp. IMI 355093]